ncbi:transcriptional repressor CTCFL-like isoform X1 [Halyomorpha halys]|uniref:transcriptional repressor CTCFL-like isoform X1 n=1 Tax=Halyomorpha halys TaxID=286706 RepID=UPI0034D1E7D3
MSTWLLYLRIKLAKPYLSLLSSEIPVLKEMTDKTEFSCGLTFIKQELIIPDEVSTIVTKEDEKPNIDSAGGLVHAKEEKDDLDEGGLIHVRQEIIYLPDESSSNWNVSIKKEMTFDTESNAGGITEVKQEVYVKHEELLISDEDSNHAPSIPHSNDSRADLDFVVDEQDLESYHMSSDDDVPSKINQEEQKNKESVNDRCYSSEKPHQCPHCDHNSITPQDLKKCIMARHTDEKPRQYPHCDHKSVTSRHMKPHIMVHHTREKPHQCPHCDYKSVTSYGLKIHIKSRHTSEKPPHCPHCDYTSISPRELKNHVMAHHTYEKLHKCPHCGYKSVMSYRLKIHIKSLHTDEKPHHCSHCDYTSVTPPELKNHIMACHAYEKPHQFPHCHYLLHLEI